MEIYFLGHFNVLDIKPINSVLAFPSTGGDFKEAFHVPSSSLSSALDLAFGFTLICRVFNGGIINNLLVNAPI